MEICCRPITHIFKDEVQALMHPTAITGQKDLGSWLSEMGMLWLSVLKNHSQQSSNHAMYKVQLVPFCFVGGFVQRPLCWGLPKLDVPYHFHLSSQCLSCGTQRWRDVPAAAEAMQTKNFTVILVIKPSLKFTFTIFSPYIFQCCYN